MGIFSWLTGTSEPDFVQKWAELDRQRHERDEAQFNEFHAELKMEQDLLIAQHEGELTDEVKYEYYLQAEQIVLTKFIAEADSERKWKAKQREEERHQEVLETIRESSTVGQAKKLVSDHPFLAGFLGADLVHRIKDK